MSYRPTSITVIGYILFGLGILGGIGIPISLIRNSPAVNEAMAKNPIPIPIQHATSIGGTVVYLLCGYFLLRGRNWARYLYVIWSVMGFLIAAITSSMKIMLIPGVFIFFVIAFFLFRPAANAFFAAGGKNLDPNSIPSTRRVVSVVFYMLAGFFFACTGGGALMSFEVGIAKTMMLCFQMLPFAICLAIGRWLSPGPHWKRDVGIVFTVAAAAGALMAVTMAVMFASPDFQKSIPPNQEDLFSDYLFGVIWFGAWALLGGALLLMSRQPRRGAWDDRQIPRLVDR